MRIDATFTTHYMKLMINYRQVVPDKATYKSIQFVGSRVFSNPECNFLKDAEEAFFDGYSIFLVIFDEKTFNKLELNINTTWEQFTALRKKLIERA